MKNALSMSIKALAVSGLLMGATQADALNILLTNDDGCTAAGIQATFSALQAAGHTVVMVAPWANQSGHSAKVSVIDTSTGNLKQSFTLEKTSQRGQPVGDNQFCVKLASTYFIPNQAPLVVNSSATPADTVLIGLQHMAAAGTPADLVVSGSNDGENLGANVIHSGTVGAAVTAMQAGVPAIALSTGATNRSLPKPFAETAAFVTKVVAKLVSKRGAGKPVLPAGSGLNINYPQGVPKGVKFTQIGQFDSVTINPALRTDGSYEISVNPQTGELVGITFPSLPARPNLKEEGQALVSGYITISTLDGSYNHNAVAQAITAATLFGVTP
jgi:5'-nucleotidase